MMINETPDEGAERKEGLKQDLATAQYAINRARTAIEELMEGSEWSRRETIDYENLGIARDFIFSIRRQLDPTLKD